MTVNDNKEDSLNIEYKFTEYDYWIDCLEYWKNEKELAIIGSTYYSNCCARIGIIEDVLKCVEKIPYW